MKIYIKSTTAQSYLYIFKHGLGPGTFPKDVTIIKEKDLPNGYTAVWTDRFLTTEEMNQYDIPYETEINKYLDRIGYCQKDGDVVPCNDVEACDVTATSDTGADLPTFREFATTEWELLNDGSKRIKLKDLFVYFGTDKQWNASDPSYWYEIKVGDKPYKESKKYSISNKERCYKAMQRAVAKLLQSDSIESCDKVSASTRPHPPIPAGWERIPEGDDDDGNWGTIAKALPNNQGYYWINIIEDEQGRRCFELEVGYRGSDGSIGKIWKVSSRPFYRLSDIVTYADTKWKQLQNEYDDEDIDACDKVMASDLSYQEQLQSKKNTVLCIRDSEGNVDKYRFHSIDGQGDVFEPEPGSGNWWTSYIVTPDKKLLMWDFNGRYYPCSDVYGDTFWIETVDGENIKATTEPKYFANMVSASSEDTYRYLIRGFYDSNRKGIAEDAWADTISEVDNIVNEYANKGYYLEVKNLETGTVLEFSADNWFDEIYPDGGFSAIPGAID